MNYSINTCKVFELVDSLLELNGMNVDFDQNLNLLGLNSLKAIMLIVYLEEIFDITYESRELYFENFSSIHQIMNTIDSKKNI